MFESVTQGELLQRMLDQVNVKYDKREGSIIFDALAPASVELQNLYISLDSVLNESFADTASREYLIRHCEERGIEPKKASAATVKGVFTPETVDVLGERFSHEDFNYVVTEKISDGVYYLTCETIGADANGVTGQLIPIDYVKDLQTAYITEVIVPGENDEDTESLRQRYFNSIKSESFGGNKQDYIDRILAISGVGGVKVYSGSEWNGGGTVKIVFVNSDYQSPDSDFVDQIQKQIDPNVLAYTKDGVITEYDEDDENIKAGEVTAGGGASDGSGSYIAPIGHIVTVIGAYTTKVNVNLRLTYANSFSWDKVKTNVEKAITSYFNTLNRNWQYNDNIRVRISQLESSILNVQGVIDVQNTTLNGKEENLLIDKDSLVTVGEINHA